MASRGGSILGSLAFLVIAPGTVAGLMPYWISGWEAHSPLLGLEWTRIVGLGLLVLGSLGVLASFARFALGKIALGRDEDLARSCLLALFPCFDECRQHVKMVALRRIWLGVHEALDLLKRRLVICLSLDRLNVHRPNSYTLVASTLSYSAWVPMKRI